MVIIFWVITFENYEVLRLENRYSVYVNSALTSRKRIRILPSLTCVHRRQSKSANLKYNLTKSAFLTNQFELN